LGWIFFATMQIPIKAFFSSIHSKRDYPSAIKEWVKRMKPTCFFKIIFYLKKFNLRLESNCICLTKQ